MDENLIEMKYYGTYYYANIISNVLEDQVDYLRRLNEFYGDGLFHRFLEPFPKYSYFHQFIEFIIESLIFEELDKIDIKEMLDKEKSYSFIPNINFRLLPINEALIFYDIDHQPFEKWLADIEKTFESADEDDVYEYFYSLRDDGVIDNLYSRMVEEVFFILFLNRELLRTFNEMVANVIGDVRLDELDVIEKKMFKRDGVLKRQSIPAWVKKAVFYRDRGRCVICNTDLSGLLSFQNRFQFDHIVPLAHGGLNDVSNIQLLCEPCNRKKRDGDSITSKKYERWYVTDIT